MSEQLFTLISAIEAVNNKPARKSGDGYRMPCPAHGGKNYNLYIADGDERLIIRCHSHGCDPKDVLESVELSIKDVFYKKLTPKEKQQHIEFINDREIRSALEIELIILLQWLSASNKELFPCDEKVDRDRIMKSFGLVINACNHYIKEGIK